eukprot:TRINITY_DN16277_c0_g1_i1.p1 TRINITY_DN16277_c0_g1~~TRINITY_DN16277_c0_g1_i1.p1  ORF type:complete len:109 (+),score=28.01 TRINITY_DN16277_c0_g1_i1:74-400(+)
MAMKGRAALPAILVVAALLCFAGMAFVSPASQKTAPAPRCGSVLEREQSIVPAGLVGAGAGYLGTSQPAHALLLQDEILPISFAVIGATLWGIVLGFVLLRLQEAFPE